MDVIKIARAPAVLGSGDTTVFEAAVWMSERHAGAVLVIDAQKRLIGIFTERDNTLRVTAGDRDPKRTKLKTVMTAPVATALPETSVEDAVKLMIRNHVRHLPIVDANQKVMGVVSLQHALTQQVRDEEASLETLADYVSAGGPG